MEDYKIIGIDLANKVFQVAALNQANKVVFNKKVSRKKFVETVQQFSASLIAMEACGSANYWARKFIDMRRIRQDGDCQRLLSIPGYGPIVVTTLISAVGSGSQYSIGRGLSANLGLTPRHHGTGGKTGLLNTTTTGNRYLRCLLIHAARTVVTWCKTRTTG